MIDTCKKNVRLTAMISVACCADNKLKIIGLGAVRDKSRWLPLTDAVERTAEPEEVRFHHRWP